MDDGGGGGTFVSRREIVDVAFSLRYPPSLLVLHRLKGEEWGVAAWLLHASSSIYFLVEPPGPTLPPPSCPAGGNTYLHVGVYMGDLHLVQVLLGFIQEGEVGTLRRDWPLFFLMGA